MEQIWKEPFSVKYFQNMRQHNISDMRLSLDDLEP
jgi:hypothetical protein